MTDILINSPNPRPMFSCAPEQTLADRLRTVAMQLKAALDDGEYARLDLDRELSLHHLALALGMWSLDARDMEQRKRTREELERMGVVALPTGRW